ncbi:hypothetical protein RQP46_011036 [Phenoliferia psychrophenolica]
MSLQHKLSVCFIPAPKRAKAIPIPTVPFTPAFISPLPESGLNQSEKHPTELLIRILRIAASTGGPLTVESDKKERRTYHSYLRVCRDWREAATDCSLKQLVLYGRNTEARQRQWDGFAKAVASRNASFVKPTIIVTDEVLLKWKGKLGDSERNALELLDQNITLPRSLLINFGELCANGLFALPNFPGSNYDRLQHFSLKLAKYVKVRDITAGVSLKHVNLKSIELITHEDSHPDGLVLAGCMPRLTGLKTVCFTAKVLAPVAVALVLVAGLECVKAPSGKEFEKLKAIFEELGMDTEMVKELK